MGMIRLVDYKNCLNNEKQNAPYINHLSLEVNLELNELICDKFPECRAYLFYKQEDIRKARSFLGKKEQLQKFNFRFQQYYYKEVKFMLSESGLNSLA